MKSDLDAPAFRVHADQRAVVAVGLHRHVEADIHRPVTIPRPQWTVRRRNARLPGVLLDEIADALSKARFDQTHEFRRAQPAALALNPFRRLPGLAAYMRPKYERPAIAPASRLAVLVGDVRQFRHRLARKPAAEQVKPQLGLRVAGVTDCHFDAVPPRRIGFEFRPKPLSVLMDVAPKFVEKRQREAGAGLAPAVAGNRPNDVAVPECRLTAPRLDVRQVRVGVHRIP